MTEIERLKLEEGAPVIIVGEEGLVTHVNRSFESAYGWKAADLIGKTLTVLIPSGLRDAHNMGMSRFLVTDRPTLLNQSLELKILTGNGTEVSATHLIVAEKSGGKWLFGARIIPHKKTS